jgi:hypothetical protein
MVEIHYEVEQWKNCQYGFWPKTVNDHPVGMQFPFPLCSQHSASGAAKLKSDHVSWPHGPVFNGGSPIFAGPLFFTERRDETGDHWLGKFPPVTADSLGYLSSTR